MQNEGETKQWIPSMSWSLDNIHDKNENFDHSLGLIYQYFPLQHAFKDKHDFELKLRTYLMTKAKASNVDITEITVFNIL
eukprot:CAMPEP_0197041768 /NCGR_PEP_ID=MMETSP1384-20130603/18267_1 /TAXON_ID=29189 /ORGANISM="Ammonia sp." /LENGTH=79 /DNA_ID=CAMNT_0042472749 /DNA_START=1 /DNA_END=240 /DNA_ORIENTATION=+